MFKILLFLSQSFFYSNFHYLYGWFECSVHVIRDLSTKAASDGMGDEMERFARGEKLRLSDQRENYK